MYQYLKHIDSPADLKKIKPEHLPMLADEVRRFLQITDGLRPPMLTVGAAS